MEPTQSIYAADTPITRYQTYDLVVANGAHTIYLNDSINYTIEEQATIALIGSIFLEGETVLSGGSIYLEGETITMGIQHSISEGYL